jgi:NADH dehydrogenase [ubiquinone] 1 alpha subcomplex assembly factor 7
VSLKDRLIEQITLEGPMNVADYMARCLLDPVDGYYTRHVLIGAQGDFLTAPMVSQMFGEMIGVWVAQTWQGLDAPAAFRLVEIGGGDGTLMSDILRVAKRVPGLSQAAEVMMVEPSPRLRALQGKAITGAVFVPDIHALPTDLPVIIIANEVLDCLPARQFVRTENGWAERCVDGVLAFGLVPTEYKPASEAEPGQIVEISAAQRHFAAQLAALIASATGTALLIDYGRDTPGSGDTLQALHRHRKTDPLAAPGQHDLTVWADFPAAADAVKTFVKLSKINTQSSFLRQLGIEARLNSLQAGHPDQGDKLLRQYARLMAPDQMGELFKVVAMAYPSSLPLFALED